MKNILKLTLSLIILLSFTSCEDVIQVKLDKGNPIVTVDAFINDMRTAQKVRLTFTDDYFSKTKNSPVIGATVSLKDKTNGLIFNFTDNTNGDYVFNLLASDTIGRLNHDYELTVNYKGTTFTSNCKLNRTAQVDSLDVEYKEAGAFGGKAGYYFKFLGFDEPGADDFYWVKSYRNGVYFSTGGINLAFNGAYSPAADGFPFIPPIAEAITPFGEVFEKNDICRVEIHSINYETFNLLYQAQAQITNSGLFATTPENIRTNIVSNDDKVKVVGWFCMSAVGVKQKVAQ